MGAAALPLLIVGAGVQAYGQMQAGRAASAADRYNAGVANANASIQDQNATWAAHEGEAKAGISQQKTRAQVAGIKADQSASGVDVNSSSFQNVRTSAAEIGALDSATIRSNAARQAYGYETEAASSRAESGMYTAKAKSDKRAGNIAAAGTLLGAGSKAGGMMGGGGDIGSAGSSPWGKVLSDKSITNVGGTTYA